MSAPYVRRYVDIVKELLLQRVDLTHRTMIEIGCGWRLAAVIHYLRTRCGWPIETILDMAKVAHYRLPPGWYPDAENPLKPVSKKGVSNEG